jgi:hypothetical protein
MPFEIGEAIQFQPAVIFDDATGYHMIFVSRDATNRLRYATSRDGVRWQDSGDVDAQTSSAAPALALYEPPLVNGPPSKRFLVAVFISNDETKRLLYAIRNLDADEPRAWKYIGQVCEESAHWVFAIGSLSGATSGVNLYCVSNENANGLLEKQFVPVTDVPTIRRHRAQTR